MDTTAGHLLGAIRRLGRKVADVCAEYNYATRRMMQLSSAVDRYLAEPDAAPATYSEFLFRTSGLLDREPSEKPSSLARRIRTRRSRSASEYSR